MIHAKWENGKLIMLERETVERKRRWRVVVKYATLQGEQQLIVEPKKKCLLTDIAGHITAAIRDDKFKTGGIWNIRWEAKGK